MYKIIIDQNINSYKPCVYLSKIDLFEYNITKNERLYVYIDNVSLFSKILHLFPKSVIFLIDKDIVFKNFFELDIIIYNYIINTEYSFKKKIIRHEFMKNYIEKIL